MKKLILVILPLLITFVFGAKISADVIIEPEDRFYMENRVHISRTNGKEGREYIVPEDTDVYIEPNGELAGTLSAGRTPYIEFAYTDENGVTWGGFYYKTKHGTMCWMSLENAEVVYDNLSFKQDHGSEIRDSEPNEFSHLTAGEPIYLWKYPNSDNSYKMENYPDEYGSYISRVYTDENGGVWGYINYIWGADGWIFTNDPHTDSPSEYDTSLPSETTALTVSENVTETETEETAEETTESQDETITETEETPTETTLEETVSEPETTAGTALLGPLFEETETSPSQTETAVEDSVFTEKPTSPSDYIFPAFLAVMAVAVSLFLIKIFGKKE